MVRAENPEQLAIDLRYAMEDTMAYVEEQATKISDLEDEVSSLRNQVDDLESDISGPEEAAEQATTHSA